MNRIQLSIQFIIAFLMLALPVCAQTGSRLISTSDSGEFFRVKSRYFYSNGRGATSTPGVFLYDSSFTADPTNPQFEAKSIKYDAHNNELMNTNLFAYFITGPWYNRDRAIFTYNSSNEVSARLIQTFGPSGWKNYAVDSTFYDNNHNILSVVTNEWTSSWTPTRKLNNSYDANNNTIDQIVQNWTNNAWKNSEKTTFEYVGGNTTREMGYYWNAAASNWDTSERTQYTYAGGDLIMTINQMRSAQTGLWRNQSRDSCIFNSTHDLLKYFRSGWINDSLGWTNPSLLTSSYDIRHNRLTYSSNYYDVSSASFLESERVVWTYNTYDQPVIIGRYDVYSNPASPLLTEKALLQYEEYARLEVSTIHGLDNTLSIFPLPASNAITIQSKETLGNATIKLYDSQGKLIIQRSANLDKDAKFVLSVENVADGLYYLNVSSGKGNWSRQVNVLH